MDWLDSFVQAPARHGLSAPRRPIARSATSAGRTKKRGSAGYVRGHNWVLASTSHAHVLVWVCSKIVKALCSNLHDCVFCCVHKFMTECVGVGAASTKQNLLCRRKGEVTQRLFYEFRCRPTDYSHTTRVWAVVCLSSSLSRGRSLPIP
jgi:hypothetical protein